MHVARDSRTAFALSPKGTGNAGGDRRLIREEGLTAKHFLHRIRKGRSGGNPMGMDREEFRAWLAAHEPDTGVGHVWTSTDCALAHYLNESRGGRWSVGCCAVDVGRGRERVREPLPDWAWTFLERVDRLRTVQHGDDPLTAREALMVIDSVDGSPTSDETVIDLRTPVAELKERELAKARHPSNAARTLGQASTA